MPSRAVGPILVIEDDASLSLLLSRRLEQDGFVVTAAPTGVAALAALQRAQFAFVVLDLNLPDLPGKDIARILCGPTTPHFMVISGYLDVHTTVELMRLGAVDVVEKPFTIEEVLRVVRRVVVGEYVIGDAPPAPALAPSATSEPDGPRARSVAHRWALHVARACSSNDDFKTLQQWASFVGVSYTSLTESCRLLGIQPLDARDLTRALRALTTCVEHGCDPSVLLDISDRRTLKVFADRAGPCFNQVGALALDRFLATQRFITPANHGMKVLAEHLSRTAGRIWPFSHER